VFSSNVIIENPGPTFEDHWVTQVPLPWA